MTLTHKKKVYKNMSNNNFFILIIYFLNYIKIFLTIPHII